jgi:hypothetical protein
MLNEEQMYAFCHWWYSKVMDSDDMQRVCAVWICNKHLIPAVSVRTAFWDVLNTFRNRSGKSLNILDDHVCLTAQCCTWICALQITLSLCTWHISSSLWMELCLSDQRHFTGRRWLQSFAVILDAPITKSVLESFQHLHGIMLQFIAILQKDFSA